MKQVIEAYRRHRLEEIGANRVTSPSSAELADQAPKQRVAEDRTRAFAAVERPVDAADFLGDCIEFGYATEFPARYPASRNFPLF
jgi:hypothetical protein